MVDGNRARYFKVGMGEWRGRLVLCGWIVPSAFLANQLTTTPRLAIPSHPQTHKHSPAGSSPCFRQQPPSNVPAALALCQFSRAATLDAPSLRQVGVQDASTDGCTSKVGPTQLEQLSAPNPLPVSQGEERRKIASRPAFPGSGMQDASRSSPSASGPSSPITEGAGLVPFQGLWDCYITSILLDTRSCWRHPKPTVPSLLLIAP